MMTKTNIAAQEDNREDRVWKRADAVAAKPKTLHVYNNVCTDGLVMVLESAVEHIAVIFIFNIHQTVREREWPRMLCREAASLVMFLRIFLEGFSFIRHLYDTGFILSC